MLAIRLVIALLGSIATAHLAWGGVSATHLDPVKVQLKWRHQFQFAGYYAALEKGFYRNAGLDVTLVEALPGMNPESEVLSGNADFGVGTSSILLLRKQGKPVVVLAVIFQHSPSVLIALRGSGIDTIHDLIGKKVMIEPNAASNFGYLQREGVLGKIKVIRHSFDLDDLVTGKVAAQSCFSSNEPYILSKAGIPYRIFSPREGGVDFYGDNIYTTEQQMARYPERVKAFRKATLLGWQYAMEHVDEMVDLIHEKYNPGRSLGALRFEAADLKKYMLPDLVEMGYMNPGRWRHIADVYAELGMMPAKYDLTGFLYDPDPRRDYTWLYWTLAVIAAMLTIAAVIMFFIMGANRKLAAQVAETERMRDKAERANTEKTHFIAAASHDLRQPAQALEFFTHALAHDLQDRRLLPLVDNIRAVAHSLRTLLDSLLDISRLEAGAIHSEMRDFAVGEMLSRIGHDFAYQAKAKGLRLRVVATDAWAHSDPMLIERILRNFVSNAIKYTTQGGVLIGCRRNGGYLRIEVHDTGIGIPQSFQKEVFREFYQLGAPERDHSKGLGLGLAIADGLARLLGHPLELRSAPARGSVFSITVPRGMPGAATAAVVPLADNISGKSILLIDDDQAVREAARGILERFGCAVMAAGSADEALDLMRASGFEPDAILTDYRLRGGATGVEAILAVNALYGRKVPAAVMTGDTAPARLREVQSSGFLLAHKPLSGAKLRAVLSSLLATAP